MYIYYHLSCCLNLFNHVSWFYKVARIVCRFLWNLPYCFQKKVMEDSIDTVIPKLIHATKDVVVKVLWIHGKRCSNFLEIYSLFAYNLLAGCTSGRELLNYCVDRVWPVEMPSCMSSLRTSFILPNQKKKICSNF